MTPPNSLPRRRLLLQATGAAGLAVASGAVWAQTDRLPVLPEWRDTAQRVASAGVPLSALAPNAPDSHTVRPGDTLWGISTLFLTSPWRWPELWGMNLEQIRNPHLIYPGQVLVLEKADGVARLRVAGAPGGAAGSSGSGSGSGNEPTNTVKLSPRVRSELLDNGAIAAIPLNLIGPFLNEAVVFNGNELEAAPRIVATQEGRVLVSRGETAYVRGDLRGARDFRLFRELVPLVDPATREVLGCEGRYVGTAELTRPGGTATAADGRPALVPATFRVTSTRIEAGVGDRLSPVPQQELVAYVPRPPAGPVEGRVVSIYGDGVRAGQNQVITISRGQRDGIERGHVLALWHAGRSTVDRTSADKAPLRLPDERHGLLFVFRVFDRVSYALVLNVKEPIRTGDRFTQP
ncbi:MAG: LysM peptidoglycan-binding domain-containing protein [Betaproteobacteria bacterium]